MPTCFSLLSEPSPDRSVWISAIGALFHASGMNVPLGLSQGNAHDAHLSAYRSSRPSGADRLRPGPGDTVCAATEAAGRGQAAEALERIDPEIKATAGIVIMPMLQDKARKAKAKAGVRSFRVEKIDQTDADHALVITVTPF